MDTVVTASARESLIATLPMKERRLKLNGVPTSVLEGGKGAPLVLLHGPGGYAAHWIRVIPALVTTHRVIAPDLPGHGDSGFFEAGLTADGVNGWLDDLIECTCTQAPILVGHTLGGAVAARFAAEKSRRLEKLVLVDSLGLTEFQPKPEFGAALQAYVKDPNSLTIEELWSQCLFDLERVRQRLGKRWHWINEYTLERMQSGGGARLAAWMELFGSPAIPPSMLERLTGSATLIWGRHDRATPLSVAQGAASKYGWRLEVIDGAADDPTIDQPEAFVLALRRTIGP
jgi:pimeloyl-ACP methyl ester carboxylesterase